MSEGCGDFVVVIGKTGSITTNGASRMSKSG
jgi:hypothetical protein